VFYGIPRGVEQAFMSAFLFRPRGVEPAFMPAI